MSLNRVLHPLQAWFHALHHKLQPVLVVLKLHVCQAGIRSSTQDTLRSAQSSLLMVTHGTLAIT